MNLRFRGSIVRPWLLGSVAFALLAGLLLASGSGIGGLHEIQQRRIEFPHVAGEVLVRFKNGLAPDQRQSLRAELGARSLRVFERSVEHLRLGAGRSTEEALALLEDHPMVEFVEPNYVYQIDKLPDDPRFVELYGLRNTGQTGGVAGADIDAERAWDLTTGESSVVVGVIDSGIDYTHPDLAANIWINPGEIPSNGIDDDGNGFVDDVRGWDFVNNDADPMDDHGHGTHVAGTIGAVGDNGIGVTGVAWKVRVVPLKFIASDGFGTTSDAIGAIEYATSIGANITNNSWGGGAFSQSLLDAIQAAADAGVLFVAAAGNRGLNNDVFPHYPSSYEVSSIISVTATTDTDARVGFANIGQLTVDLGAPGVSILSTFPRGAYGLLSGTSMSSPHVAGAAALVRSLAPHIGADELKKLLLDNTDPIPSMATTTLSGGRLNVFRAVSDRDQVPPGSIDELTAGQPSSNSITLRWVATGDDGDHGTASVYDVRYDTAPIGEESFALAWPATHPPRPGPAGSVETMEIGGLAPNTVYYFAVRARDEWGNPGPVGGDATAVTLPAPVFDSSPASFEVQLFAGQRATRELSLGNVGPGTLDWRARTSGVADAESVVAVGDWLSVAPVDGRLLSGARAAVTMEFDSRGLPQGTFEASVDVETNDPDRPVVAHPVSLEVIGAPAIELEPNLLDFGRVFVGDAATIDLLVTNFGTEPLEVTGITTAAAGVAASPTTLRLAVGESRAVGVSYTPENPATLDDSLLVSSNAPSEPLIEIPLIGSAASPPAIRFEPPAIEETLLAGETISRTLRIRNDGESVLEAFFYFEPGANPGPAHESPLVNGGFETGDFTGWSATWNDNLFGWVPWTVTEQGGGWFENSEPVEGSYDALNGFDGQAGLAYELVQELAMPPGLTHADLSFFDRIQYHDFGNTGFHPKRYLGTIEDLDGNVLASIVDMDLPVDGSGYRDLGWQRREADLRPFSGQTVRLRLRNRVREAFLAPGQIEFDGFHLEIDGFPRWFHVVEASVSVPPGAFAEVQVVLDARSFISENFDGFIRIETNVPSAPQLLVPVALTVFGAPDIAVLGQPVTLESTQTYSTSGAVTLHSLPVTVAPGDHEGAVELVTDGDLGNPGEGASFWLDEMAIGTVGNFGSDCVPVSSVFPLSSTQLAAITADGIVEARIQNSPGVGPICQTNSHTVRLSYTTSTDRLEYGQVVVGAALERTIFLENRGTDILEIPSIASDLPQFRPSDSSLTLTPGTRAELAVTFRPASSGTVEGTLHIQSNDADTPSIEIALSGGGIPPPAIGVDPVDLDVELFPDTQQQRFVTLSNSGESPLRFAVEVLHVAEPFVTVDPVAGVVPVDGSLDLGLTLDATGLATGRYLAFVEITSNDPSSSTVTVPVTAEVIGAARIALGGEAVTSVSSIDFTGPGALTVHVLDIEGSPAGSAEVELTAVGEFGGPTDVATATVEGVPLEPIGATGADCQAVSRNVALGATELAPLVEDGVLVFEVQNSETVGSSCAENRHGIRVTYLRSLEVLRFGKAFVGTGRDLPVTIENAGVATLHVDAIVIDADSAFSAEVEPFALAAGESRTVAVTFAPTRVDVFNGLLSVFSSDPVRPVVDLPLVGFGTEPPVIQIDPPALDTTVGLGQSTSELLTVINSGSGPLDYTAGVHPAGASYTTVQPASGSIPPGSSSTLVVEFDASRLPPGPHATTIEIDSNDPDSPRLVVPATLTVTGAGAPDLIVGGDWVALDSRAGYSGPDARTVHEFLLAGPSVGRASLELTVQGDFGNPGETATATAEGRELGVSPGGETDCSVATNMFPIRAQDLAELTEDGLVEVEIQNSPGVGDSCPDNFHAVRLNYHPALDRVDFGTEFIGATSERVLFIENLGVDTLEILSLESDTPEFTVPVSGLSLPPGGSESIPLAFAPQNPTDVAGLLRIASNDPDTPLLELELVGVGAFAPRLDVHPAELTATIFEGGRVPLALTLRNSGAGPLDYSLGVSPPTAAFVQLDHTEGSVPPGGEVRVSVVLDGTNLEKSLHAATIEVASDAPAQPTVRVPVSLSVIGAPDIGFVGETVTLESTMDFLTIGALTRHILPVPVAPAGDGQIQLVVDGDYGASIEFAVLAGEGRIFGSVGGIGTDCSPALGNFPVGAEVLTELATDGRIELDVQNNGPVDPNCIVNRHTVRVVYDARRESLEFGVAFLGQSATRQIKLLNNGSEPLEVSSITSDVVVFAPSASALSIPPGDSAPLGVRFTPFATGAVEGTLTLLSNDPDTPALTIPLSGTGAPPPALTVDPASIEAHLDEGTVQSRTLTVSNSGGSPLEISVEVLPVEGSEDSFTLFGTDGGSGNLYAIDPATADATLIGYMAIRAPSLAVDPTTGVVYAGQGGGVETLYTVDPVTAIVSIVGDAGLTLSGLDFTSSGQLYGAANAIDGGGTGGDGLALVNKATGVGSLIGSFGNGIGTMDGPRGIDGIAFDPSTGVLYGASGQQPLTRGVPMLYTIDTATGEAAPVGPIIDDAGQPAPGGLASLQFGPGGTLFGGTGQRDGRLIRIDPETGLFRMVGPAVDGSLGGLALRKNPPDLSFVGVSPATLTVVPSEQGVIDLLFDARRLPAGLFEADVVLFSNDPDNPVARVTAALTVAGVPDIAVVAETVLMESVEDFTSIGATTSHLFDLASGVAGGARLDVVADGDFGSASERAEVFVGGVTVGRMGQAGADCSSAESRFILAASDLAVLAEHDALRVDIANPTTVSPFCHVNRHTVRLTHDTPLQRLDFGTVFLGYEQTISVTLRNDGRADLQVGSIVSDAAEVTLDEPAGAVPPFGSTVVPVTFRPTAAGSLAGSLRISSNDPDESELTIELAGRAIVAPEIGVQPGAIETAMPPRASRTKTKTIHIRNNGGSDLIWSAEVYEIFTPRPAQPEWVERPKGDESTNGTGANSILRVGGPDAFGYQFKDSDEPDGPAFEWTDIRETGTPIDLSGDDETSRPVRIGFDFPFYGETFDTVNVSSNGWLSFTSDKTSYSNASSLPNNGLSVPENLVAPFWDDLDLLGELHVHYLSDGSRFIVQFSEVDRFASSSALTFQVMLHASGQIRFQYQSMSGVLDSATIGIQNGSRSTGLLVAYNEDYVHDGLAVEIARIVPWTVATPTTGVVSAGGAIDVELELSSADLYDGEFHAEVLVRSNDPAQGEVRVPLTLHTAEFELDHFEIEPGTVNLKSNGRTIRAILQFPPQYDPREATVSSVAILDGLFAEPLSVEFADTTGDGVEELILRFDRQTFHGLLVEGEAVPVSIGGDVGDRAVFRGTTRVRVIRPGG